MTFSEGHCRNDLGRWQHYRSRRARLGPHLIGVVIYDASVSVGAAFGGVIDWAVETLGYAIAGIAVGAVAIPVIGYLISPLWKITKKVLPGAKAAKAKLLGLRPRTAERQLFGAWVQNADD